MGSEAINKKSLEPHKVIFDTKLDLVKRAEQEKKRQEELKLEEEQKELDSWEVIDEKKQEKQ